MSTDTPPSLDYESPPPPPPPPDPLPTGWAVPAQLFLLAFPIIASMVSRTVMSFVDFLIVSKLSTDAQAAIMPAGILVFCVVSFGMGMVTAVNTFVAQSLGAQRHRECSSYAWQGLYLALLYSFFLLPSYFLIPPLFRYVGHAPHVQQMEIVFAQISILGLFPSIATPALANFFNGIHKPSIGLWSSIIANVFNAAANLVLVFGFTPLHIPAMGIAGSALGTVLATLLQALILLGWLMLPKYHKAFHTLSTWRFHPGHFRQIFKLGLPAGIQFTTDIVGWTIFTLFLVGRFGTEQLAASNIAFKWLELSFMPAIGVSVALTSAVGKAMGQRRPDHARLLARWATLFTMIYMGVIALLYVFIGSHLAAFLGATPPNPVVQQWTVQVLYLCAIFQIFDALGLTHIGALRGAGDNHFPAIAAFLLTITVLLPGGFLLAHYFPQYGILGPWAAGTMHIILLGIIMALRWRYSSWEKINLLAPA